MSAMTEDRLVKMREERAAREKARIEKLRELNLKKYNKNKNDLVVSLPNTQKQARSNSVSQISSNKINAPIKNNFHVNGTTKRPITAPIPKTKEVKTNYLQKNIVALKSIDKFKNVDSAKDSKTVIKQENRDPNKNADDKIGDSKTDKNATDRKPAITNKINNDKLFNQKPPVNSNTKILAEIKPFKKIDPKLTRKSMSVFQKPKAPVPSRKSMIPKVDTSKESVFDRLYKPKFAPKNTVDAVEKLQTDPNYLKKVIRNSGLIVKRHSCFDKAVKDPVRRSISAVHFKRISKNEVSNCIHKWASSDKLNTQHLTIDEGESIKEDKVISAVKSERKKVTFWTPMSQSNTPRPEELQTRLKAWLQKRGKSLDAYHHLQCFGLHHLPRNMKHLETTPTPKSTYNDENKENIAVDSDSDNESYTDNMTDQKNTNHGDTIDVDNWRQTSFAESVLTDFNETADFNETTVTSADTYMNVDDLLRGALVELTELLKEGFGWEQAARYLRAIRYRFPDAPCSAAYWECRAALEERRGDLHASVECWEEAIAKGTERNVVEANLDTLLNKFMQLKISPHSSPVKCSNPKMVDVKNVFKSTIIRFAVQQAKLRESEEAVFTVTPVRRSGRLSNCPTPRGTTPRGTTPRVPLRVYETVKQVYAYAPQHVFTPNDNLVHTP